MRRLFLLVGGVLLIGLVGTASGIKVSPRAISLLSITSNLLPATDATYDVGSAAFRWRDVVISRVLGWTAVAGDPLDTILGRAAAANLRLGDVAANPPVAQTLSVQNASGANIAGAGFTIDLSQGTGTGIGGGLIIRSAAAGGAGSALNALATFLTIGPTGVALASGQMVLPAGSEALPSLSLGSNIGFSRTGTTDLYVSINGTRYFNLFGSGATTAILAMPSYALIGWNVGGIGTAQDLILARAAAANLRLGLGAANPPVAQTISVQNASGTDIVGANFTIDLSQGTGTGAGGGLVVRSAAAGLTGSALNALATLLTVGPANVTLASGDYIAAAGQGLRTASGVLAIGASGSTSVTLGATGATRLTITSSAISVANGIIFDMSDSGSRLNSTTWFSGTAPGGQLDIKLVNAVASPTTGAYAPLSVTPSFTPASGSASFASLHLNPTINGTSSGTAYGLVVASKTNVLTGGTIKLLSLGTTTTDGFTGYTERAYINTLGDLILSGEITLATSGDIIFSARSRLRSQADGVAGFLNSAQNGFTRLILGTNDASGVAWGKSGTTLRAQLGDGTGQASFQIGSASLTLTAGAFAMEKIAASASAPGAAGAKFEVVCGTNVGTAKLVMAAGTSATVVTVVDNVGAGVTGC